MSPSKRVPLDDVGYGILGPWRLPVSTSATRGPLRLTASLTYELVRVIVTWSTASE
jgi:hypothetical protein